MLWLCLLLLAGMLIVMALKGAWLLALLFAVGFVVFIALGLVLPRLRVRAGTLAYDITGGWLGFGAAHRLHDAVERDDAMEIHTLTEGLFRVNPNGSRLCETTGGTPLRLAIQKGNRRLAEQLIKAGANPNCGSAADPHVCGSHRTPLQFAADTGDLESAELLLKLGASPDIFSVSALGLADLVDKQLADSPSLA